MIKRTLTEILKSNPKGFLLDASGVIYTDKPSAFESVPEIIQHFQTLGPCYLITNNAFQNPKRIETRLNTFGIHIPESHIISSGSGLEHDPVIRRLIENKIAYVFGSPYSHEYIIRAKAKKITPHVEESEVIVLTSGPRDNTHDVLAPLISHCHHTPEIPVICCNPDRMIRVQDRHQAVVGYYAETLEEILQRPIHWIGKPLSNFTKIVKKIIQDTSTLTLDKSVWFFDDNLENVMALQTELGISGCWIKDTGIAFQYSEAEECTKWGTPDAILPALSTRS